MQIVNVKTLVLSCAAALGAAGVGLADDGYGKDGDAVELSAADQKKLVVLFEESLETPLEELMALEKASKSYGKKGAALPCGCGDESECTEECAEHYPALARLTGWCRENAAAHVALTKIMTKKFGAADTSGAQRERMIDMLSWDASELALACGEGFLKAKPAAFSDQQVVAFAERGSENFEKNVKKRAKKSATILPAAFLAMRGDDTGQKSLVKAARTKQIDCENVVDTLLASAALKGLGEGEYYRTARLRVMEAVLVALDEGDLDGARGLALSAEFFAKEAKGKWGLGYMGQSVSYHCRERSKEVATADQIFALIERITPL